MKQIIFKYFLIFLCLMQVYQGTWVQNKISRNVVYTFINKDYNPDNNNVFISGDVSVLQVSAKY